MNGERGFTILESAVSLAVGSLVVLACLAFTFQSNRVNARTDQSLTALSQVQNTSFWISRDAQMSQSISANSLPYPNLIIFTWQEYRYSGDPVYHSVTYSVQNVVANIGTLQRYHWRSEGASETTVVAKDIYYCDNDPSSTTKASYSSPVLSVAIATHTGTVAARRELSLGNRTNFSY